MEVNLTSSQRDKISQFKSITNISNDDVAVIALKKTNWNLDLTITQFFDNPNELLNGNNANNANADNNANHANAANNENGNRNTNTNTNTGWSYYAMFGWNCFGSIFGSLFGFIYPYFASAFSMIVASSNHSQNQIVQEFETNANNELNGIFVKTSLNDLISQSFASSKCILIYFHNPQSAKCNALTNNVLCDQSVKEYLRMNMIGWLGDKRNSESNHLWRQISHGINDKRYPFVCIAGIHPRSRKLVLVHRQYCGNITDPTIFIGNVIDHGYQRWHQFKGQQIMKEQQTQSNRNLRQVQDIEYNRAVMEQQQSNDSILDQPVKKEQVIESMSSVNDNSKYQTRMESAKAKMNLLTQQMSNCAKLDLVKVALRLPNGQRVETRFSAKHTIGNVFDFAMSNPLKIGEQFIDQFDLICSYPKKTFTFANDNEKTLKEAGIESSVLLFVQET